MSTKKEYEVISGAAAYEKVKAKLLAIAVEKLIPMNADLDDAAMAALGLVDFIRLEDRFARLKLIPEELIEPNLDEKLETMALAARYVALEATKETAGSTGVKVDVAIMAAATEVRKRMLKTVKHNLDDIASVVLEVADIELGSGYLDTASDLLRLIALYLQYAEVLKLDGKHYSAKDVALAQKQVAAIHEAYRAAGTKESAFVDMKPRAFTELSRLFNELREGARFVYRGRPDILDELPALRVAMGIVGKRTGKTPTDPTEPTDPNAKKPA